MTVIKASLVKKIADGYGSMRGDASEIVEKVLDLKQGTSLR